MLTKDQIKKIEELGGVSNTPFVILAMATQLQSELKCRYDFDIDYQAVVDYVYEEAVNALENDDPITFSAIDTEEIENAFDYFDDQRKKPTH